MTVHVFYKGSKRTSHTIVVLVIEFSSKMLTHCVFGSGAPLLNLAHIRDMSLKIITYIALAITISVTFVFHLWYERVIIVTKIWAHIYFITCRIRIFTILDRTVAIRIERCSKVLLHRNHNFANNNLSEQGFMRRTEPII